MITALDVPGPNGVTNDTRYTGAIGILRGETATDGARGTVLPDANRHSRLDQSAHSVHAC